ncbi:3-hydroxyacyl-CoA dehydrogenase [Haloactinopolyspora alba]|uniref:3-hydroxyacyl-CoA dehydrogenase n=1 Tax=Haloactinopolyspora alba TaxID=648780 RepID=A0A2P8EFV7_9ACTN|nr:hydroxyphenylacetyl-CoA thioesterase PaaI [Haloactinopolyspora alba]PSL08353.1 3-hydroxyacyl-CoA dehydrogenase [Haloactinopolyspora alba]
MPEPVTSAGALAATVPVGVVGAGTMGAGIAQVAAVAGHPVRLHDQDGAAAERAVTTVGTHLDRAVAKGRLSDTDAAAATDRLSSVTALDDLAGCGLVVEAIVEDLAVKQQLFADLERICAADAVLASNTSSLSVDDLALGLAGPGRVAGLHFFNPAPVLPLVEVVAGARTDPAVLDTLVATARRWGKTPVRAASTPGFIVNRVARPYYGEAFRLLESGLVDAVTVDAMLRESGGFRMGPFELIDLIGLDVNLAVSRSVWEAFDRDPRFEPSPLQERLVADGRLGRKTGHGVHTGDEPRPAPSTAGERSQTGRTWTGVGGVTGGPLTSVVRRARGPLDDEPGWQQAPDSPHWVLSAGDVVLRLTDGRTAAQHTGGGPATVVLVDLALQLDYAGATRVGVAAPEHAPAEHVDAAVGFLQHLGYTVTVLPDIPGLVVARTVAMLAAFAADAVDTGVASADDVDTAMRLGVNYPRGPYAWGEALGWSWVVGVLDALAAADDARRYRVSPQLRARAEPARSHASERGSPPGEELARRAAAAMWAGDAASQALGMTIDDVSPGHAVVSMTVREDMVNGHGICHGGLIFALADTAFAFACNSYNRTTVAQSCDITFVAPARRGDRLEARARERHRGERSGVYDVTVVATESGQDDGHVAAEFRGRCRQVPGTLVDEEEP